MVRLDAVSVCHTSSGETRVDNWSEQTPVLRTHQTSRLCSTLMKATISLLLIVASAQ